MQAAKTYMLKRYEEDYQHYLLSDSLFNAALTQKDAGEYRVAAENMLEYFY